MNRGLKPGILGIIPFGVLICEPPKLIAWSAGPFRLSQIFKRQLVEAKDLVQWMIPLNHTPLMFVHVNRLSIWTGTGNCAGTCPHVHLGKGT
jgi:hypothetical protein